MASPTMAVMLSLYLCKNVGDYHQLHMHCCSIWAGGFIATNHTLDLWIIGYFELIEGNLRVDHYFYGRRETYA